MCVRRQEERMSQTLQKLLIEIQLPRRPRRIWITSYETWMNEKASYLVVKRSLKFRPVC